MKFASAYQFIERFVGVKSISERSELICNSNDLRRREKGQEKPPSSNIYQIPFMVFFSHKKHSNLARQ